MIEWLRTFRSAFISFIGEVICHFIKSVPRRDALNRMKIFLVRHPQSLKKLIKMQRAKKGGFCNFNYFNSLKVKTNSETIKKDRKFDCLITQFCRAYHKQTLNIDSEPLKRPEASHYANKRKTFYSSTRLLLPDLPSTMQVD